MSARRLMLAAMLLVAGVAPSHARELTREFLVGTSQLPTPVSMSEYTPPSSVRSASQRFEGRLRLSGEASVGAMKVLRDDFSLARQSEDQIQHLPAFDFELIQSDDALVPVRRGSLPSKSEYWEYLVEPGRVWTEPADGGLARAALPFSLQERNANCIHNGVLTFVFGDDGVISRVAYQISSETCAYFKADLWGVLPAQYVPGVVVDRHVILQAFSRELAARLPARPIESLSTDYPNANPDRFGSADEVPAPDMTAFGFVIDDKHYVGGCQTRHGPYPFCDVLDLPSYSLAKSLFAGLATMRLERLYPGTLQRRISDYVPECARPEQWRGVTFEHALDMATGNFSSPVYDVDERSAETSEFFIAEDHAAKIHIACREHPHRAPAGTRWVYHTTNTYVLGAALSAYIKERAGKGTDLYQHILVQPLWRKLGLSPVLDTTRRTRDQRAQPFTGWGLVMHRDDIARIARFLNTERGRLSGESFFDERSFAAAMQLDPADRGLPSIDATFRYNNGFWAHDVSGYIGCGTPVWIPYLVGYGGIIVLLMPNDTVYYYFSDGSVFRWSHAAVESNRIRSLCKAAT